MSAEALVKNKDGIKESKGACYLDVLKHAVKTIILNLGPMDRFSITSFSSEGRVDYDLDYMTTENQTKAID